MLFRFENTIADIDLEKTKSYHKIIYSPDYCHCSGCKNFKHWTKRCNPAIREAFRKIGIEDMRYFSELSYPIVTEYQNQEAILYMGMYYVVGTIVHQPENLIQPPEVFPELPDYFQYCISDKHDLVPDDFPRPALQLDFYAYLPWIVGNSIEEL